MTPATAGNAAARRRLLFCIGLLLAVLAAASASYARLAELKQWHASPESRFVNGIPVMTTTDAYYVLRWAQAVRDGSFVAHADDPLRHYQRLQYPREVSEFRRGDAQLDWRAQRQPRRLPLLSAMIAAATPLAGSVERAGLYLTPVLAGLFIVPMFLYGWRIGQPAAALLGGLFAAFTPLYFARTQLGFVDTDCLNLFFPWLASLLIVAVDKDSRGTRVLLAAAALGATLYAYFQWYEKPAVSALYWATFAMHLAVQRRRPALVAAALVVCVVCSHPVQAALAFDSGFGLIARYLGGSNPGDGLSAASAFFPNVMLTVSEQRGGRGLAAFATLLARPEPGVVGVLSFAAFALLRWKQCLPLLPLLLMAAFAFISGPRFAMYLAPLAGMGLGLLIALLAHRASAVLAQRSAGSGSPLRLLGRIDGTAASYAAVLALFWFWLLPLSATGSRHSDAAVPADTIRALHRAGTKLPGGAPLWTWWDYGFAYAHLAGLSVFHDGAAQYTPQTNVIAHTFMDRDQAALHRTMTAVDRLGNRGIAEVAARAGSREALLQALAEPVAVDGRREIYLAFTRNMIEAASALRFVAGLPTRTLSGEPIQFEPLPCRGIQGRVLKCDGFAVDLDTGAFTDGRAVRRLVIADNGRVVKRVDFPQDAGFVLELVVGADGKVEAYRLPDALYESNLNRMFLLGEYDRALFEEVYVEVPVLRVFRQKRVAASGG
jgi:undecaprenyl-diphosphooligosaccharide--protein glycosyltransferase